MKVLVFGGTRMMGRHLVKELLSCGHSVTIANRGRIKDDFGSAVERLVLDRTDEQAIKQALSGRTFDVVYDSLAYCSNDVRRLLPHLPGGVRYLSISSTAVYRKHWNTVEEEFNPLAEPVIWGDRGEFPYDEGKRQAERALAQLYPDVPQVAVRFPFVIGEDDYTRRLAFYVEHIMTGRPMHIDNCDAQMAFVRSAEAGKFLAFLADQPFQGAVNGASSGTVSLQELCRYVEEKTGKRPVLSETGDPAPYNGEQDYSINTLRAENMGFHFSPLREWFFSLVDQELAAYS